VKILLIGKISLDINREELSAIGGSIFHITANLCSLLPKNLIKIIYPLANDDNSKIIATAVKTLGIAHHKIQISKTPTYSYDENGAIIEQNFDLYKQFSIEKLASLNDEISNIDIIISDLNFVEALNYIRKLNPTAKVFIDATSAKKVQALDLIDLNNTIIKFNREQASQLAFKHIFDVSDCFEVRETLLKKRISKALITLDKDGCYFYENNHQGFIRAEVVTNKKYYHAGSAFLAAAVHAYTLSPDLEFMAHQGIKKSAQQIGKEIEANFLRSLNSDK
jgi:sugar/nucleoside kinase (ribokinase family)